MKMIIVQKKLYLLAIIALSLYVPSLYTENKRALIFGVTGQDGSYLSEFLLAKGYDVYGVKRRTSLFNTGRVDHLLSEEYYKQHPECGTARFYLHYGDITDAANVFNLIGKIKPDEIYNLAAQSHVQVSFELPLYTTDVDAVGTLHILEAIIFLDLTKKTKFYNAATSELFGKVQEIPQKETTPFYPRSPYAVAKLYSYWITKNYREAYSVFACNGILFNHESPRRGETFVTRKITRAVARIKAGQLDHVALGNIDSKRDWGFAGDYVEAMWLMLQNDHPDDFVVATGETHSVREFIEQSFAYVGIQIEWQGHGLDEVGINKQTGTVIVRIDKRYFRPTEVDLLLGDATKAKTILGWKPRMTFVGLVAEMMKAELQELTQTPC